MTAFTDRTSPVDWEPGLVVESAFVQDGHFCIVAHQPLGFRLAYVHIPDDHPFRDTYVGDVLRVHGGVTYEDLDDRLYVVNGDGVPAGHWVGWDYAHHGDAPDRRLISMPALLAVDWGNRPGYVWSKAEVERDLKGAVRQLQSRDRAARRQVAGPSSAGADDTRVARGVHPCGQ